ncbi:RNA helicase Mov10l1 [Eucyclogobius newberryi]|uniref:RNA helicase Mov10l1 n=1 Tax=Eucyclogobius newberryi TaxID=166745 RepID=UPI003B5C7B40
MLTAVRCMFNKLVSPIWRSVEEETGGAGGPFSGDAVLEDIRHLRGSVVTQLCLDYGMIDGAIYFTSADVLGGMSLKEGDLVNCIAVRGGSQGGWKALRVEKSADAWEEGGKSSLESDTMQPRPLIGTVTSYVGDEGYINQNTAFSRHSLSEGYEPMKGDWVRAKYVINPSQWTTRAQSVAPLRYSRLDKVQVTSVYGNSGVVEDAVFFCLDSLLLPADYRPAPGDRVNLVMVESTQSFYNWRALCIAPCGQSEKNSVASFSEVDPVALLGNKGGLDVSNYGNFGDLMMGERRTLVIWIQNKGLETQTLKCCEFANWDSEKQFSLFKINGSSLGQQKAPSQEPDPAPPEESSATKEAGKGGNGEDSKGGVIRLRRAEREVEIPPGQRISIAVACDSKILGCCAELLLLHFSSFTIGRRLDVTVGSEEEALLTPAVPYVPVERAASTAPVYGKVITVSAPKEPPKLTKRRLPNFLPNFPVPQALKDCVETQSDVLVSQSCLGEELSAANMHARFSSLLWLEELHAEQEIQEFTINGALLKKGATYLHLEVLGLAEGRPNLNTGDKIVLKKPLSDGTVMEIISYVAEINSEDVSLRVNYDFQRSYLGEPLDVAFSYNRLTTRRCHHALEQVKPFAEILFPSRVIVQAPQWTGKWMDDSDMEKDEENETQVMENGKISSISVDMKTKGTQTKDGSLPSRRKPREGRFFNPDLNATQREAVKRILSGECRPTPYILFGPPGTGKTITLIESILQVYHFLPSSRVLVCTPSNSAADLVCIRLHHSGFLDSASLARVNASCRQDESIPDVLRSYSRAGEDVRHASFRRIVVSTCSSAGMFHNLGVQVGHFTHVFLDEAGQALEPEALIPISLVSETDGQIVLAGDPRQLGPIVKSKVAAAFGLGVSLLERLMVNPLYSRHDWGYNPRLVTKLVYNYRSHEALLTLPSRLFYDGELRVKAPRSVVQSLCQWKTLPKKGFPLLFHGVRGTEMREGNNPSWFNPAEAVQVMLYCCQLTKKLYNPVSASDIGIIAPYRKQCEKIRVLLSKVGLSDIKVGSVEEFQGQEYLVIILSTVRSNESVPSDDLQSSLGFLSNPKRFNVAITRTKALLLIVGNPHILIRDPCFRALLEYSFINGAYLGCNPPPSLKDTPVYVLEQAADGAGTGGQTPDSNPGWASGPWEKVLKRPPGVPDTHLDMETDKRDGALTWLFCNIRDSVLETNWKLSLLHRS